MAFINPGKGIRLRKGNIQIGSKHTLLKLFREKQRGNYYFFGEVHALSPDLIPNARRDYFLDNSACKTFEDRLKNLFHCELSYLYNVTSKIRNANRRIQDLKKIHEEAENFKPIDKKEQEEFNKQFQHKKSEAEKAKKDLERISAKFGEPDAPVKKIFDKVVDTEGIDPSKFEINNSENPNNFRVNMLTKLSREQRKFLSRIFSIIRNVQDKQTAENLIKRIEDELR
jgi:molecular chaperone HtpG